MNIFYNVLINSVIASITNMTVWFAIIFYIYLQTKSVFATAIISGLWLVGTAASGFWFGSIVDHNKKKTVLLISSYISLLAYILSFLLYITLPSDVFTDVSNPFLWVFILILMAGVLVGNLRGIVIPTLVTLLVPEENRDKANGLSGTAFGVSFLITSVISGFLVGHSGMYLVLILAIILTIAAIVHLLLQKFEEKEIVHVDQTPESIANGEKAPSKIDIRGTIKVLGTIPGLFALILFTTFNNFLGGVFMSLMDAYGLSLVSVQVWGLIWGFLSTAFIIGGLVIAKWGLGKNPLRTMFIANLTIWVISSVFTIQPSIVLLTAGCFVYLIVIPFIEASEHTIIQKVVPPERQGRVFGFAQSVEQSASPLTAFLIGPLTQFIFIPFMTDGRGADLIGNWYGTGEARGMALVFTVTGIIGLFITLLAMRSKPYRMLSNLYTTNTQPADKIVPQQAVSSIN
jgi:MFS transporter, DHA3 family, multidrug efflux protein